MVSVKKASIAEVRTASKTLSDIRKEISKVFLGHEDVVDSLLRAFLCNGHVLVEGVPGIAKTLLINTLARVSGCSFSRVQFTVDLLPTDILGLTTYTPNKGFEVVKGPIFSNFVIADEINRSPPKTQSALIEAMQERQVTIGKTTYKLPTPFFVMASQNPLENEGVYQLPEAQIDRFIFKVLFGYPKEEHEEVIMEQNVTFKKLEDFKIRSIVNPKKIGKLQSLVHEIYLDQKIRRYIIKIVSKTRNKDLQNGEYIEVGASPRASIALYIASKAEALLQGRNFVLPDDVRKVAPDVLRHRIILSYRARASNIDSDTIIQEILQSVRAN